MPMVSAYRVGALKQAKIRAFETTVLQGLPLDGWLLFKVKPDARRWKIWQIGNRRAELNTIVPLMVCEA